MMLDHLGEKEAAKLVDNAVAGAFSSGKIKDLAAGKMGLSTTELGDLVAGLISG
jgi:3-isopropylmalate dehydrogenase